MAKGMHGFVSFRLRDAREVRGMSAASLADCIGISRQSVSQYEKGKQAPSPEILRKISETLNIPIQRFMLGGAEVELGIVFYRSMGSATKTARLRAEKRLGWLLEAMDMIHEHIEFPSMEFPVCTFSDDPSTISTSDIENAAQKLRETWGLSDGPIGNLVWVLESRGAIVARHEMLADTLDAFSAWSRKFGRPIIVLGSDKDSACRSRFDAAHELGHIILHRNALANRLTDDADFKLLEDQAHRFAASFLLPEDAFAADLYSPTLDAMLSLKHKWRVAISAMIQRAWQLDLINDTERQRLFIGMSRRKWRRREPLDGDLAVEQPRVLPRSVEKLVEAGIFSRYDFPNELGLSDKDVEQTLCLSPGFFDSHNQDNDPTEPQIVRFPRRRAQ